MSDIWRRFALVSYMTAKLPLANSFSPIAENWSHGSGTTGQNYTSLISTIFSFFSFIYCFAFLGSSFVFCFILFFRFWCWNLSSLLKLMHDYPLRGTKSLFMTVQSSIYTYSVIPTGRLATFKRQVFIYVKMTDRFILNEHMRS